MVNGNTNTYLIKGLEPASEYEVLLAAVYANEVESDEVVLVETTGKLNPAHKIFTKNSSCSQIP